MRIGIDFDNTIVSYDALFYKVAREKHLVPIDTPINKVAVRDHLRMTGREDAWTELQGYVYGARMGEAVGYPGAFDFIKRSVKNGHDLFIVSHKTKNPFLGKQYDLHEAARFWVSQHLHLHGMPLIPAERVFFEPTKEAKIQRANQIGCEIFIDDLPEILSSQHFPVGVRRILFDPECNYTETHLPECKVTRSWSDIEIFLT